MPSGYRTDPLDEYEHILYSLKEVLPEAEENFNTAELRMMLTAKANKQEDLDKLLTEQVNWGLDYLRRQDVVESVGFQEIGARAEHNLDWSKNDYTDERLEEVLDQFN